MADTQYGDTSMFQARGGDPIQEREAARAEATKRASYLSSMDQFYAQLDFMKEVETGKREMFEEELAFKGKELESLDTFRGEQIALGREQLGAESERWKAELEELRSWHKETIGFQDRELKSRESMFGQELKFNKDKFDVTSDLEERKFGLFADINAPITQIGSQRAAGYNFPIYGRTGSNYSSAGTGPTALPPGGIGAGTQARWLQESAQEHESDLLDSYFSRGGS